MADVDTVIPHLTFSRKTVLLAQDGREGYPGPASTISPFGGRLFGQGDESCDELDKRMPNVCCFL